MKVFCVCLGIVVVMLGIWVEVGTAQNPITITETQMPDDNLQAVVLAGLIESGVLSKGTETFTDADMRDSRFTRLEHYGHRALEGEKIEDLTGLQLAINLETLIIKTHEISAIPDMTGLTALTRLDLTQNEISDISNVADLSALTDLRLDYNNIDDISGLANLSKLELLYIGYNSDIGDISHLANLTGVRYLNLGSTGISDISVLANLPDLEYLFLEDNNISDISVLANLTDLTYLDLTDNPISSLSAIVKLTKLTSLSLGDDPKKHRITDVREFEKLLQILPDSGGRLTTLVFGTTSYTGEKIGELLNDSDALEPYLSPPPPPPPVIPQSLGDINAGTTETLTIQRVNSRTVTLCWDIPTALNPQTITYEHSIDGGQTLTSNGSTNLCITLTGDGLGDLPRSQFQIRAMNMNADGTRSFVIISAPATQQQRRTVIQECPVGWIRSDGFAGRTRRVLLYEVKLEMDIHNPISVYKPDWIAIYVHPDEGLENLDGWKLQVAIPYNHHREYLLTAENSVVVDAGFVEGGFAFIENPKENPFPMVGMGFTGSPVPGFDYRLYDETGRRVDFGISCYKRFDVFQVLKATEDPRVLRKVLLESFDWDSHYLRSEWTVPMPAPAAPSLVKKSVVGTWGDLKKQ